MEVLLFFWDRPNITDKELEDRFKEFFGEQWARQPTILTARQSNGKLVLTTMFDPFRFSEEYLERSRHSGESAALSKAFATWRNAGEQQILERIATFLRQTDPQSKFVGLLNLKKDGWFRFETACYLMGDDTFQEAWEPI